MSTPVWPVQFAYEYTLARADAILSHTATEFHHRLAEEVFVTKGIEQLTKALPNCKIDWNGGVIEPKK